MILSHTILILQLRYSREATANRAPGQPLVFTAPGRFESAPVGYFNMEVAAAAGRGRGDNDDDDDDGGYAKRREYRKQKGKRIKLGPIKLVRGGGWCDNCNAATDGPVVEVAAAAGRGKGDDNDDDDDNSDDDDDDNDAGNQKPSGGGIILVPRAERRRDHRGMASVTTTIGERKRKATGGPAV